MKWMVIAMLGLGTIASAETVAGHYVMNGMREAASDLILKADGRFEFVFIYGAADFWGGGKWKMNGSAVELHSDAPPTKGFLLKKSAKAAFPGLKITVMGANGHGVANIDIGVDTTSGLKIARTDNEGVAWVEVDKGWKDVSLAVRTYGFECDPIALAPDKNDFVFDIDGKGIMEMRFDGDRLEIGANSLQMKKFDPARPVVYKKR